jgi:glutamate-5-semialdehyde dehydrogenase
MDSTALSRLEPGMPIVYGGDRVTHVPEEIALAFEPGDALVVVQATGELLHLPAAERAAAREAVDTAVRAFDAMGVVEPSQLDAFYEAFATALEDDDRFAPIAVANAKDVADARARGRSVTRLILDDKMRAGMIAGLRGWGASASTRGEVVATADHDGWRLESVPRPARRGRVRVRRPAERVRGCLWGAARRQRRRVPDRLRRAAHRARDRGRTPWSRHCRRPDCRQEPRRWSMRVAGVRVGAVLRPAPGAGGCARLRCRRAPARCGRAAGRQRGLGTRHRRRVDGRRHERRRGRVRRRPSTARSTARCATPSTSAASCGTAPTSWSAFLSGLELPRPTAAPAPSSTSSSATVRTCPRSGSSASCPSPAPTAPHDEPQAETIVEAQLGIEWEWEDSPEVTLAIVDDVDEAVRCSTTTARTSSCRCMSDDDAERHRVEQRVNAPFVVQRLHALGRRAVRARHPRARPVELGARTAARTLRDPVRRHDPHDAHARGAVRPGPAPMIPGVDRLARTGRWVDAAHRTLHRRCCWAPPRADRARPSRTGDQRRRAAPRHPGRLAMSDTVAGVLTMLPPLSFGVFGLLAAT